MSRPCFDRDNSVHPDTFANIRIETECVGSPSHRVSCRSGNLHRIFWPDHQCATEKMVTLSEGSKSVRKLENWRIREFGLTGRYLTVYRSPLTI
jgi:hypothetical protein